MKYAIRPDARHLNRNTYRHRSRVRRSLVLGAVAGIIASLSVGYEVQARGGSRVLFPVR
jgi:hypothetical protein